MKKIRLLTPLFATTSIAAATIPLVSCGENLGKIIKMDIDTDTIDMCVFVTERMQLEKDTLYTLVADLSKLQKCKEVNNFMLESLPKTSLEGATFKKVAVNNIVLNETSTTSHAGWAFLDGVLIILQKEGSTFKATGKVKISFILSQDIDGVRFALGNPD